MQKGQDASGIIIIDKHNRVLLVHQTYGIKSWSIPGGMVEDGESVWDAAARELKEETNISAVDMEVSGMYFQPHKNRYIYTFKAFEYEGVITVDNKEIDQYGFYSIEELPKPISSFTVQRIKDALANTKVIFRDEQIDSYEILY
ncbi:NUDIX hydrolase [Paenibacillus mendelii]|uniref:NUDIX hydrolase n=1 Tax=Paenibacillus mendelii TaxID=206163 RepID=A0ABV6JFN3_9BACL|nr:NUDIX hydrolase [Paenibacillus mendelii]MCQ6557231.1 NUDIX hydrolase [Paenibacillus mendelii]